MYRYQFLQPVMLDKLALRLATATHDHREIFQIQSINMPPKPRSENDARLAEETEHVTCVCTCHTGPLVPMNDPDSSHSANSIVGSTTSKVEHDGASAETKSDETNSEMGQDDLSTEEVLAGSSQGPSPEEQAEPQGQGCYCGGRDEGDCWCEMCAGGCGKTTYDTCECRYCPVCDEPGRLCYCEPCEICAVMPEYCRCAHEISKKVRLSEGRFFQSIDTSDAIQRGDAVRQWGPYGSVLVAGDLADLNVFVVRKPSTLVRDVSEQAVMVKDATIRSLKTSRLYLAAKTVHSKIAMMAEPEHEAIHTNVTTTTGIRNMVTSLASLPRDRDMIALSFDCEAWNLGRFGTTCYIQIRDELRGQIYLVDLLVLGQRAWTTKARDNVTTLKSIFKDSNIVKLVYDTRADSDALYNHYGIKLAGVLDVQYLAMLNRRYFNERRPGYNVTMDSSGCLTAEEQRRFAMNRVFPYGKDYSKFMLRPLPTSLKVYAIGDVLYLRRLASKLKETLTDRGIELAFEWTANEIRWTWEEDYHTNHYNTDEWEDRFAKAETKMSFAQCWREHINAAQGKSV